MMSEVRYRTTLDLAVSVRKTPRRILRDLKHGVISADRPGHEWLFTPEQFQRAIQHYRGELEQGTREAHEDRS